MKDEYTDKMKIVILLINILLLIDSCESVEIYLSTKPVVFGGEAILTCKVGYPLKNSKECPVREWSGGRSGRGILYNQFPSNKTKYEDRTNDESDEFSLVIKHFDELDVNKNYTCSCGFDSSTTTLKLDNSTFISIPEHIVLKETPDNDLLTVELSLSEVYPVPTCFLYINDVQTIRTMTSRTAIKGIFFDVVYQKQIERKCELQVQVDCTFPADVNKEYNFTLHGNTTFECQEGSITSLFNQSDDGDNLSNQPKETVIGVTIGVIIGAIVVVVVVSIFWKLRCTKKNKDHQTLKYSNTEWNSERFIKTKTRESNVLII